MNGDADSAHARSQAQWLKELIAAYTEDLRQYQHDLEGYSPAEGKGDDDDMRVGSQHHLARKLHGVSEKHKEHLSRALKGVARASPLPLMAVQSYHRPGQVPNMPGAQARLQIQHPGLNYITAGN